MTRILLLATFVLFASLGASIGYFNSQSVEFFYLVGSVQVPLIVLIALTLLLGIGVTLLVAMFRVLSLKAEIRRLRRRYEDAQVELRNLRALTPPPAR